MKGLIRLKGESFRRAFDAYALICDSLLEVVLLDELEYRVLREIEQIRRHSPARAEFEVALLCGHLEPGAEVPPGALTLAEIAEGSALAELAADEQEASELRAEADRLVSALCGLDEEELAVEHAERARTLSQAWTQCSLAEWRSRVPAGSRPRRETISKVFKDFERRGFAFIYEARGTERTRYYLLNPRAVDRALQRAQSTRLRSARAAIGPENPHHRASPPKRTWKSAEADARVRRSGFADPPKRTAASTQADAPVPASGRPRPQSAPPIDGEETKETVDEKGGRPLDSLPSSASRPDRELLRKSRLPRDLQRIGLEGLEAPVFGYAQAAAAARRLAAGELGALILSGTSGSGKTTLAAAAAWELLCASNGVRWVAGADLELIAGDFELPERKAVEEVLSGEAALFIDDLDVLFARQAIAATQAAIRRRLARRRAVVITTPLERESLAALLGADLLRRLERVGSYCELSGADLYELTRGRRAA